MGSSKIGTLYPMTKSEHVARTEGMRNTCDLLVRKLEGTDQLSYIYIYTREDNIKIYLRKVERKGPERIQFVRDRV
jgi:hypothetical protein